MFQKIDFGKLSLMDALDLAIFIEEEAQERYEEFVDQMELHHTPVAAAFFRHMATNEAKHGADLVRRRKTLFPGQSCRVSRDMLWDVEAPEYDQARVFMSARQAMEVALLSETKAYNYFVNALQHITDVEVRKLFEELRDEEVEHQELVRREMAKLPASPDIDPDLYADEPVAH